MDGQLRDKVASGVAWSMAEKVGTMLLQLAVSLTILRLLNPAIMGVIAIPTAFLAVAIVIADSGFSQALIRKGTPTADDYKSVFAFNVGVALVLYGVLVALAGSIARFYDMPEITRWNVTSIPSASRTSCAVRVSSTSPSGVSTPRTTPSAPQARAKRISSAISAVSASV